MISACKPSTRADLNFGAADLSRNIQNRPTDHYHLKLLRIMYKMQEYGVGPGMQGITSVPVYLLCTCVVLC